MKIEEISVTRKERRYVASDGLPFTSEGQCVRHEREILRDGAQERTGKFPSFQATPKYVDADDTWTWFYVESQEDVDTICLALYEDDSSACDYKPTCCFPCWIFASVNDEGYGEIGTYEDFLKTRREEEDAIAGFMKERMDHRRGEV